MIACHHDCLKMSHHHTNTKYGENASFIHQEIVFSPRTVMMLLYLATLNNWSLNNIQKDVFCGFFMNVPAHRDGGTYLKLANKIQKSLEEVTSLTKTSIICFA